MFEYLFLARLELWLACELPHNRIKLITGHLGQALMRYEVVGSAALLESGLIRSP